MKSMAVEQLNLLHVAILALLHVGGLLWCTGPPHTRSLFTGGIRNFCLQAWDCPVNDNADCGIRSAPCHWGGPQYQVFFSNARGKKNNFYLFYIHFANRGNKWCLTNTGAGKEAKLQRCNGKPNQKWFIPKLP